MSLTSLSAGGKKTDNLHRIMLFSYGSLGFCIHVEKMRITCIKLHDHNTTVFSSVYNFNNNRANVKYLLDLRADQHAIFHYHRLLRRWRVTDI